MKIPIIYEDRAVVVIDKPAGLLVHDVSSRSSEPTVADFSATKSSDSSPGRPGIVHRLDRDTSGVMIIAKNAAAKTFLQDQFRQRLVQKEYLALVEGHLRQSEAVIDLPIARKSNSARYVIDLSGRPAETAYKLEAEYPGYSYLRLHPKTGRTHQIRVHFAHLGHPLAGDRLYGARVLKGLSRQFLHSNKLTIQLPGSKSRTFESPLPADLVAVLDSLKNQI